MAPNTWGRWESGATEPTATNLAAIRDAFDVSIDFLLRPRDFSELWVVDSQVQREIRQLKTANSPYWTTPWGFRLNDSVRVETDRAALEEWRAETERFRDGLPKS